MCREIGHFTTTGSTTPSVLSLAVQGITPCLLVSHYTIDFHISEGSYKNSLYEIWAKHLAGSFVVLGEGQ